MGHVSATCSTGLLRGFYYCSLRVHVPKYYILWPQSTYIGTILRPKYIILFGHMDPSGFIPTLMDPVLSFEVSCGQYCQLRGVSTAAQVPTYCSRV